MTAVPDPTTILEDILRRCSSLKSDLEYDGLEESRSMLKKLTPSSDSILSLGLDYGKRIYSIGIKLVEIQQKSTALDDDEDDVLDLRIPPLIMSIGYEMLELICKASGKSIPISLHLQFLSFALKISKTYFKAKLIHDCKLWLSSALDRVNTIKSLSSNNSDLPDDVLMGLLDYNLYNATLNWNFYCQDSKNLSNSVAFRLVNNAISSLSPSLKFSKSAVKSVYKTCLSLSSRSERPQDCKKWISIALKFVDEVQPRSELIETYQKNLILNLMTLAIQDKNSQESNLLAQSSNELIRKDPQYYMLCLKSLGLLQEATSDQYLDVFTRAMEHCFGFSGEQSTLELSPKDLKNLVALIFLISKNSTVDTAHTCIAKVMGLLKTSPIATTISSSSNPASNLSILSIYLLCEKRPPTALQQIRTIMEQSEWDPLSEQGRVCLLQLWKTANSIALDRQWSEAVAWYQLASNVLSVNASDFKNKASICRKISICFLEQHKFQQALPYAEKGAELDLESSGVVSPLTHFLIFTILFKLDNVDRALEHLRQISFAERADLFVSAADIATESKNRVVLLQILKMAGQSMSLVPVRGNCIVVLRYLIHLCIEEFMDLANEGVQAQIAAAKKIAEYLQMSTSMLSSLVQTDPQGTSLECQVWKAEIEGFFRSSWNIGLLVYQNLPQEYALVHVLFESVCKFIALLSPEDLNESHSQTLKTRYASCCSLMISLFIRALTSCSLGKIENDSAENAKSFFNRGLAEIEQFDKDLVASISLPNVQKEEMQVMKQQQCQAAIVRFELLLCVDEDRAIQAAEYVLHDPDLWNRENAWRFLDIALQQPRKSVVVITALLENLLQDMVSEDEHLDLELYAKWARLLIQSYIERGEIEKLNVFLVQFNTILEHSSVKSYGESFQSGILWAVVAVWNLSTELWSVNDHETAKIWMELALRLSSVCDQSTPQIKVMREAYGEFLGQV